MTKYGIPPPYENPFGEVNDDACFNAIVNGIESMVMMIVIIIFMVFWEVKKINYYIFWGQNFLGRENLFWDSLSISVPTIQNQCAFSWKQELQVKNFEPRDYSKRTANQVSMRETEGREKSNECNQCAYASYHAGNLGKHLKIHSGEKTNKCNQCDYACSEPSALRSHLKTHSGENQKNATNATYPLIQAIWGDIWEPTLGKIPTNATNVTMHPLEKATWGRILKFEGSLEPT